MRVIIPFRDRGIDPHRAANLEVVQAWWYAHGFEPMIVDDGLDEAAQFNRHRAYNRAVERFPETEVFIFTEADMLIHPYQIDLAVDLAAQAPGLVVPFTQYRYLSGLATTTLRDCYHDWAPGKVGEWWSRHISDQSSVFRIPAESTMDNGRSIGAVNVISAETLHMTGGFTEATRGNWYDDRIIEEGFAFLTQPTRYIEGPAVHLYHLPGWKGKHLSDEDKAATLHNKSLLTTMRGWIRQGNRGAVQGLMTVRSER
jgi:hypothetical protein